MFAPMDAESFLRVSDQFRLGELVTEQPHPETVGLAELARHDLPRAIAAFHRVDLLALQRLGERLGPLPELVEAIRAALQRGGRIFLCGCGATGRLALSLETLAREAWLPADAAGRVIGFMAGGDAALIRSIEAFEDHPEHGVRQLRELGFGADDLLLAITEGGETPFVIGACLEAATLARQPPWFLFCNPPEPLGRIAARARRVLESPRVRPFCLEVGPMALAGSTRLQATTVQMLVAGAALSEALGRGPAVSLIGAFRRAVEEQDPGTLAPLIGAEASVYAGDGLVLYQTDHYGITVLTDTTERSPTFSLAPFENRFSPADPPSPCYLALPRAAGAAEAWERLLGRPPRTLEWPELGGRASLQYLLGHDISAAAGEWRAERHPGRRQAVYTVRGPAPALEFAGHSVRLAGAEQPLLVRHLLVKLALNLQSTLVMGRLGRFESNLMTRVRPSNHKLVDRAARHVQHHHLQRTGIPLPYPAAVRRVFASIKEETEGRQPSVSSGQVESL